MSIINLSKKKRYINIPVNDEDVFKILFPIQQYLFSFVTEITFHYLFLPLSPPSSIRLTGFYFACGVNESVEEFTQPLRESYSHQICVRFSDELKYRLYYQRERVSGLRKKPVFVAARGLRG